MNASLIPIQALSFVGLSLRANDVDNQPKRLARFRLAARVLSILKAQDGFRCRSRAKPKRDVAVFVNRLANQLWASSPESWHPA